MSEDTPLVSAIVPAWNAQATLADTLASIAAQTWPNLEIVIVDDGSTDETAAIAEAFCRGEPHARLIRQENRGLAAANNAAIRDARGDWIAPCDSDDIWHPTKIAKQVAAALAAPQRPAFVWCWSRGIDAEGFAISCWERLGVRGSAFDCLYFRNFVGNGSALLFDAAALREAGGYDEGLRAAGGEPCVDILVQLKLAARRPIEGVEEWLVGYRIGRQSMSSDAERMIRSWRAASREARQVRRPALAARRWTWAARLLGLAEQRAGRGRFGGAAAALLTAAALDPRRTFPYLAYRSLRRLGKRLRPSPPPGRRHFLDWGPREPGPSDAAALPAWEKHLDRLTADRMRRLNRS